MAEARGAQAAAPGLPRRFWDGLRTNAPPQALYVSARGFGRFDAGETQPLDALPAWCAAHAGEALHLVLGASLTHTLVADAALPLADEDALREHARLLLAHYHGPSAAHWPLAPWRFGMRRGVVALHGLDLAVFAPMRLRAAEPYWAVALRAACGDARREHRLDDVSYLIVEGALVTVVEGRAGQLEAITRRRLDDASPAALVALIAELRSEVDRAQTLVVCGHGLAGAAVPLRGCTLVGSPLAAAPGPADWLA